MGFKIIDGFCFFNEFDMLEMRLKLLFDYVDKFVIVEANKTHAGADKPLNFPAHAERFRWAAEKIIYYPVQVDTSQLVMDRKAPGYDPKNPLRIETAQRSVIINCCAGFDNFDLLVMGDIDEIPSREVFENFRKNDQIRASVPMACRQEMFYYNLQYLRLETWCGSVFSTVGMARHVGTQYLRDRREYYPRLDPGGWHLSYFADPQGIVAKIQAFSHQEVNRPKFLDSNHIDACIKSGKDLFNRDLQVRKVGREFFPAYFYDIACNYPHFL